MNGYYTLIDRYYDAENQNKVDDLQLYSELAPDYGGPILEIGSGSGRVMFHLAQEGYEVHGIEPDLSMLKRAEARRKAMPHLKDKVVFHKGDALKIELKQQYNMVLLTYNMLTHFSEQETQIALFKRLREWTAAGGVLVIDLPNAGPVFNSEDTDAVTLERTFIEPESGHLVMQQSVSALNRSTQVMSVIWLYDEIMDDGTLKRTFAPINFRYYFLAELTLLLKLTGFEVDEVYGDYEGGEFGEGVERMIIIAKPK